MTTPTFRLRRGTSSLGMLLLLAALVGCGGSSRAVAPADLGAARSAIASAEEAGAAEHAPLEIRTARQKLERAQAAADRGDHQSARIQGEQAVVDARLAETKARATRQEANLQTVRSSIETLREEIERNRRAGGGS
jgi:capsule polysaccharide export protein KpsE/RkpR